MTFTLPPGELEVTLHVRTDPSDVVERDALDPEERAEDEAVFESLEYGVDVVELSAMFDEAVLPADGVDIDVE